MGGHCPAPAEVTFFTPDNFFFIPASIIVSPGSSVVRAELVSTILLLIKRILRQLKNKDF